MHKRQSALQKRILQHIGEGPSTIHLDPFVNLLNGQRQRLSLEAQLSLINKEVQQLMAAGYVVFGKRVTAKTPYRKAHPCYMVTPKGASLLRKWGVFPNNIADEQ